MPATARYRREGARKTDVGSIDWTRLRDRWEYSHVARAVFAGVSFISMVFVVASAPAV